MKIDRARGSKAALERARLVSTGEVPEGTSREIHVAPLNDFKEHDCNPGDGLKCWCEPKHDDECPDVIVHNSMDDRESYENGRAKH